jgi:site-specific DNA-cytosine methylase
MKTGITLFSGMGGSAYGMLLAGIKDLYFNDFEPHAIECLRANFPGLRDGCYDNRDISKVKGSDILRKIGMAKRELDILQMSPPCQDFSTLNNNPNKSFSERNQLYAEGLRIVGEIQPKVVVIENVAGFIYNTRIFLEAIAAFEKSGYLVDAWKLDSAYYGSAQSRPRVWIVGYRKDLKKYPTQPPKTSGPRTVVSILPDVRWLIFPQFGGLVKSSNIPMPTITKTPNFLFGFPDGSTRGPKVSELKLLSDFPVSFKMPGESYIKKWNRIGNAVLPEMMKALCLHILKEAF